MPQVVAVGAHQPTLQKFRRVDCSNRKYPQMQNCQSEFSVSVLVAKCLPFVASSGIFFAEKTKRENAMLNKMLFSNPIQMGINRMITVNPI